MYVKLQNNQTDRPGLLLQRQKALDSFLQPPFLNRKTTGKGKALTVIMNSILCKVAQEKATHFITIQTFIHFFSPIWSEGTQQPAKCTFISSQIFDREPNPDFELRHSANIQPILSLVTVKSLNPIGQKSRYTLLFYSSTAQTDVPAVAQTNRFISLYSF